MTGRRARALRGGPMIIVLCLGLGAGRPAAQDRPVGDRARLNPLSDLRPADVSAFKERPLFTPSRRAPEAVAATQPPPSSAPPKLEEPPTLQLLGVVQAGTAVVAVVRRPDETALARIQVGDDVDGWLVTSIDAVGLRLVNGDREQEYRLFARSMPLKFGFE